MTQPSVTSELGLPELHVDVVEPGGRARKNWNRCEIDSDVRFSPEDLKSYCLAAWQPIVYDAFLLAAATQFCDEFKKRPQRGWARSIRLCIPVHDPARWNDLAVCNALHEALNYLTGDNWSLTFKERKDAIEPPMQQPLELGTNAAAVIPYSDGMDSLAAASLAEREYGDGLIRVRLGSNRRTSYGSSANRSPFTAVPYQLCRRGRAFPETSGRCRGFKFAVLSGMAGYLTGAREIIVPESGQGALGPWLMPVGQAHADMRNHPFFMRRMEIFLNSLLGYEVRFKFPRLWYTKGETLSAFVNNTDERELWTSTWSCWQSARWTSVDGRHRQCGVCAACMLRRLAVHAAGLNENPDRYVWEDLSVAELKDGVADNFGTVRETMRQYAIAGVLHLDHLADLNNSASNGPVLRTKVSALARHFDMSSTEVDALLQRLLAQHEYEWKEFVQSLGPRSFVAQWAKRAR